MAKYLQLQCKLMKIWNQSMAYMIVKKWNETESDEWMKDESNTSIQTTRLLYIIDFNKERATIWYTWSWSQWFLNIRAATKSILQGLVFLECGISRNLAINFVLSRYGSRILAINACLRANSASRLASRNFQSASHFLSNYSAEGYGVIALRG